MSAQPTSCVARFHPVVGASLLAISACRAHPDASEGDGSSSTTTSADSSDEHMATADDDVGTTPADESTSSGSTTDVPEEACDVGTRCNANVVEICTKDADGIEHWAPEEDCSASDSVCRDELLDAHCESCNHGVWEGDFDPRVYSDGFDALVRHTSVSGSVWGLSIESFDDLECLHEIGGDLLILQNPALTSLEGLSGLTSIGGTLTIGVWPENLGHSEGEPPPGNPQLPNLDGLSALGSVGGGIQIGDNDSLANLDALGGLVSLEGGLDLVDNPALVDLDGLAGVSSIGGGLRIEANTTLADLDGLASVTSIGVSFLLEGNTMLTNVDGLSGLTSLGGSLEVVDNDALTNLDGLAGLGSVAGISVDGNGALANLDGLAGLTLLSGRSSLRITDNTVLPTCEATFLADILMPYYVTISGNDDAGVCE